MKILEVCAIFALLHSAVTSSEGSHDYQLVRLRRDADFLETSIDRLKMVARVTAGIQLTQDLIKGTAKTEEMAAELLKISPVTPTQIAALDTTALEAAVTGIKNLQTSLSKKTINAEKNAVIFAKAKAATIGLKNFKDWEEKATFDTSLGELKANGTDLSFVKQLKNEILLWTSNFNDALGAQHLGHFQGFLNSVKTRTENIINLTANATIPMFSAFGSAGKLFSKASKLIDASKFLSQLDKNVNSSSYALIGKMLNTYNTVGVQAAKVASTLATVESIVATLAAPGVSRNLNHTYGLLEGLKDIEFVFADINSPWMTPIVESSSFDRAMVVLRKLLSFSSSLQGRFGALNSKDLDMFTRIRDIVKNMKSASTRSAETIAAVQALGNLSPVKNAPNKLNEMEPIQKRINELDALTNWHNKEAVDAVAFVKTTVGANLTLLVALCTQAQDAGAVLADLKTKLQEFDDLRIAFTTLHTSLGTIDNAGEIKARAAQIDTSLVQTFLSDLDGYSTTFGELSSIAKLELIGDAFGNIDKLRNMADSSGLDRTSTIIASIGDSKSEMTKLKGVLDEIKGEKSKESDALGLLRDSKKTVESIGRAVKVVATMDEVFKRKADVAMVIQHIALATSEIPNGFDQNDTATLSALVALKPQLSAMTSSLDTWHTAVKDVLFDKLTDGDDIFSPSKNVTGITTDLVPMVVALEHLIEKVPNSSNMADLKSMKNSLSTLSTFHLDFATYHVALDSAGASLVLFSTFLAAFHLKMGSNSRSVDGNKDGGRGANGAMTADSDGIPTWGIVLITVAFVFIIASIAVPTVLIIRMIKLDRTAKKERDRWQAKRDKLYGDRNAYMIDGVKQNTKETVSEKKLTSDEKKDGKNTEVLMANIIEIITTLIRLMDAKTKKNKAKRVRAIAEDDNVPGGSPTELYESLCGEMLQISEEKLDLKLVGANRQYTLFETVPIAPKTRVISEFGFFHGNLINFEGGPPILAFQSPIAGGNGKVDTRSMMWKEMRKQNVQHICMLTDFKTKESDGCAEHFGQRLNDIFELPGITITTKAIDTRGCINSYELQVAYFDEQQKLLDTRTMFVHHYVSFPPKKAPKLTAPLIELFKRVDGSQQTIAIHCATGVGPTGIAVFGLCARRALLTGNLNMFGLLTDLRGKRAGLIETTIQFAFCFPLVIDYALGKRTLKGEVLNQYNTLVSLYTVLLTEGVVNNVKSTISIKSMKVTNQEELDKANELLKLKDAQIRAKYSDFYNYSHKVIKEPTSDVPPSKTEESAERI